MRKSTASVRKRKERVLPVSRPRDHRRLFVGTEAKACATRKKALRKMVNRKITC